MAKKYTIHVKGGFSERKGLAQFSDVVQTTTLNTRTRNKIYSTIQDIFTSISDRDIHSLKDKFCEYFYEEVLSLTKNHIPQSYDFYSPYDYGQVLENIYEITLSYAYNEVFDLIESMIKTFNYVDKSNPYKFESKKEEFINKINKIFLEENVNYKIVSGIITDITSDEEINSINDTLENKEKDKENE